jgi:hypothetical protein
MPNDRATPALQPFAPSEKEKAKAEEIRRRADEVDPDRDT